MKKVDYICISALHFPGHELVARFSAPDENLSAEWRVILRDGSTYVRQQLVLRVELRGVLVRNIELFDQQVPNAHTEGAVDGSPVAVDSPPAPTRHRSLKHLSKRT